MYHLSYYSGGFVSYFAAYGRYNLIPQGKGLFIFDRKTATHNYCDSQTCQMIQPVFPLAQNEAVLATIMEYLQNTVIMGQFLFLLLLWFHHKGQ